MDKYLKIKTECCESQSAKMNELIVKSTNEKGTVDKKKVSDRIMKEKSEFFKYYIVMFSEFEKIKDVGDGWKLREYERMFNKITQLTEFGGGHDIGTGRIQVRRHIRNKPKWWTNDDWNVVPSNWLVVLGPGTVTQEEIYTDEGNEITSELKKLQVLYVGRNITDIEDSAFQDHINLKTIVFQPHSKCETIKDHGFISCDSLSTLYLPDSLKEIGVQSFENCISLKSLIIPKTVQIIGNKCFKNCGLVTLEIHYHINLELGRKVFEHNLNLKSVRLTGGTSDEWKRILKSQFKCCPKLEAKATRMNMTTVNYLIENMD